MIIDHEHNTNGPDCWCCPQIITEENGNKVVIHNDIDYRPDAKKEHDDVLLAIESSSNTADLFRRIRKARCLTIQDVSAISCINRNTIGGIERGDMINGATLTTLAKIAHALMCDLKISLKPFEEFTKKEN